ncbi:transcriptional regulator, TetR family [Pseudogulbenkiania sp. NH8B]|uniref:TetR/AcrR family transcriptional regulator n=1 Tax=Pseudogulbenkiania sp. (strain NH8B) TaxID=748280 RepID=UPI00022793EE|nr:TetR/AcrR family transcriptional regulator [Pseudogulbenkiania sp. NH8B]BAK75289.1 transcriptional regulator, TetR family [Pseudogulbenkiania sp. NH8B]
MSEPTLPRWQRKKDARPSEILDAALSLFVEKGFRATKMEDIAHAANVTKGTPYLYFQNKEEIFKAVIQVNLSSRFAEFAEIERQHSGSAAELLQQLMFKWWDEVGCTELAGICKLVIAEATNFPELAQFYAAEVIQPSLCMVGRILQRGIANGEFRAVPIESATDALLAPLVLAMTWAHSFGKVVPEGAGYSYKNSRHHLAEALDLVLNGLCAPSHNNN